MQKLLRSYRAKSEKGTYEQPLPSCAALTTLTLLTSLLVLLLVALLALLLARLSVGVRLRRQLARRFSWRSCSWSSRSCAGAAMRRRGAAAAAAAADGARALVATAARTRNAECGE
jgi:hypothetical protein